MFWHYRRWLWEVWVQVKPTIQNGLLIVPTNKKDGLIWFDFIQKNCEVTEQMYGKLTNCIKINMATDYNKFALAYPELQPESEDKMKRLDVAQTLSDQTENLINIDHNE